MPDITRCSACGGVHDIEEPCDVAARPLPVLDEHALDALVDPDFDLVDEETGIGMVQEETFEVGYAATGAGKTTFYTQRAFAKATGSDVLGFKVTKRGRRCCAVCSRV